MEEDGLADRLQDRAECPSWPTEGGVVWGRSIGVVEAVVCKMGGQGDWGEGIAVAVADMVRQVFSDLALSSSQLGLKPTSADSAGDGLKRFNGICNCSSIDSCLGEVLSIMSS